MAVFVRYNKQEFYVDNFANHPHNYEFTRTAWKETLKVLKEKGIKIGEEVKYAIVWSDGGLKTKENLDLFREIAVELGLRMEVNFFAPYHGHNEVDGHFAAGKKRIRGNADNGPVMDADGILEAFGMLADTTVNRIEVEKNEKDIAPLENQIRCWFQFELRSDGVEH